MPTDARHAQMGQNGGVQTSSRPRPRKPQRRPQRRSRHLLRWVGAAAVLGLLVYGVSQMSGVPYDDVAMGVVDFSVLNPAQKVRALKEANRARCTCGCGMTLAECVATDRTCPVRDDHIERIKGMVAKAMN